MLRSLFFLAFSVYAIYSVCAVSGNALESRLAMIGNFSRSLKGFRNSYIPIQVVPALLFLHYMHGDINDQAAMMFMKGVLRFNSTFKTFQPSNQSLNVPMEL